jgi:hypothetical protein
MPRPLTDEERQKILDGYDALTPENKLKAEKYYGITKPLPGEHGRPALTGVAPPLALPGEQGRPGLAGVTLTPAAGAARPERPPGVDAQFNTVLTPPEEARFQQWKARYAPQDSGDDYDLRGAFKAGFTPDPATGHWLDTYKKPNHPTFSDQSRYAPYGTPGTWRGDTFVPPAPPAQPEGSVLGQMDAGRQAQEEGTPSGIAFIPSPPPVGTRLRGEPPSLDDPGVLAAAAPRPAEISAIAMQRGPARPAMTPEEVRASGEAQLAKANQELQTAGEMVVTYALSNLIPGGQLVSAARLARMPQTMRLTAWALDDVLRPLARYGVIGLGTGGVPLLFGKPMSEAIRTALYTAVGESLGGAASLAKDKTMGWLRKAVQESPEGALVGDVFKDIGQTSTLRPRLTPTGEEAFAGEFGAAAPVRLAPAFEGSLGMRTGSEQVQGLEEALRSPLVTPFSGAMRRTYRQGEELISGRARQVPESMGERSLGDEARRLEALMQTGTVRPRPDDVMQASIELTNRRLKEQASERFGGVDLVIARQRGDTGTWPRASMVEGFQPGGHVGPLPDVTPVRPTIPERPPPQAPPPQRPPLWQNIPGGGEYPVPDVTPVTPTIPERLPPAPGGVWPRPSRVEGFQPGGQVGPLPDVTPARPTIPDRPPPAEASFGTALGTTHLDPGQAPGPELQTWIRSKEIGGIKLTGEKERSEWQAIIQNREAGTTGLLNDKGGLTPQQVANEAERLGYIGPGASVDELRTKLDESLIGWQVYPHGWTPGARSTGRATESAFTPPEAPQRPPLWQNIPGGGEYPYGIYRAPEGQGPVPRPGVPPPAPEAPQRPPLWQNIPRGGESPVPDLTPVRPTIPERPPPAPEAPQRPPLWQNIPRGSGEYPFGIYRAPEGQGPVPRPGAPPEPVHVAAAGESFPPGARATNRASLVPIKGVAKGLYQQFQNSGTLGATGKSFLEAVLAHPGDSLTFRQAEDLLSQWLKVGRETADIIPGQVHQFASHLSRELYHELDEVARSHGPDVERAWRATRDWYRQEIQKFDNPVVQRLMRAAPDQALSLATPEGSPVAIRTAREAIDNPYLWDMVGQSKMRQWLGEVTNERGVIDAPALVRKLTVFDGADGKTHALKELFPAGHGEDLMKLAQALSRIQQGGTIAPWNRLVQALPYGGFGLIGLTEGGHYLHSQTIEGKYGEEAGTLPKWPLYAGGFLMLTPAILSRALASPRLTRALLDATAATIQPRRRLEIAGGIMGLLVDEGILPPAADPGTPPRTQPPPQGPR